MPIGPGVPSIGPAIPVGGHGASDEPEEPFHHAERCKRCEKEAELVDGLCPECKWEIDVGMKPPIAKQEKHHHWPFKKEEKIQES